MANEKKKERVEVLEYALCGRGYSGRGVRMRELPADERNEILSEVALALGKDASMIAYQLACVTACVQRMIVQVTEAKGLADAAAVHTATWIDVTAFELQSGPQSYKKLFNAKDDALLAQIYRTGHEVGHGDAELVMGKAIPVVLGE